jgi:signal peptidase II
MWTRRAVSPALFLALALLGGGCDLSTKHWAQEVLGGLPGQSLTIIDPLVELSLSLNEGTAFSLVPDLGDGRLLFGIMSLLVVVALFVAVLRAPEQRVQAIAFGLIAGGAIGNGADRILRAGVVDFIRLSYPWGGSWPTFNIADVLLVAGGAMLLVQLWRVRGGPERTEAA